LHAAALGGKLEIVMYLVEESNADLNMQASSGESKY
jgi:hypothetical protein